jgi:hypothetical protein
LVFQSSRKTVPCGGKLPFDQEFVDLAAINIDRLKIAIKPDALSPTAGRHPNSSSSRAAADGNTFAIEAAANSLQDTLNWCPSRQVYEAHGDLGNGARWRAKPEFPAMSGARMRVQESSPKSMMPALIRTFI